MNDRTKRYYKDNEGDPWFITEAQTWDLKKTYGFTFEVITKEEFTERLTGE